MNRPIYLDNAATTAIEPVVLDAMLPYLKGKFGNASTLYSYGIEARMAVEESRNTVARVLNVEPSTITFTSCGTESINTSIMAAVRDLGCKRIITSGIEHPATLHTCEFLKSEGKAELNFVELLQFGHIDIDHLEKLLKNSEEKCVVSLMHANNEIGNMIDVKVISELCTHYEAVFHCDTVQTIGHYPIDLKVLGVQFAGASAHKFHGPKGIGILYIQDGWKIKPFMHGGAQEKRLRAGTENVAGFVGFAKALELANKTYEKDHEQIQSLKTYLIKNIQRNFNDANFNGDASAHSLYTVLSVSFPKTAKSEMLLTSLAAEGICVSGGSACSGGASHVIETIDPKSRSKVTVRFSFSKHNTTAEIDKVVEQMRKLL